MRAGRISLIVVMLCLVALFIVPLLRQGLFEALQSNFGLFGKPHRSDPEVFAKQHPRDYQAWLAVADNLSDVFTPPPILSPQDVSSPEKGDTLPKAALNAWGHAIILKPGSPVPNFRYALELLAMTQSLRRSEEYDFQGREEPKRSNAELANLYLAEQRFERASIFDPDNAACDYLLVYIRLVLHRDTDAFTALRSAVRKTHWSFYQGELDQANLHLSHAIGESPWVAAQSVLYYLDFREAIRMKGLVRHLLGFGDQFRKQGDHRNAILCCQAIMHLGHVMRVDSHSVRDGLLGVATTSMASSFVSERETKHIKSTERIRALRVARLATYFAQHGRSDLAVFYRKDTQAARAWLRDANDYIRQDENSLIAMQAHESVPRIIAAIVGIVLGLLLVVFFISLIISYWREQHRPPLWRWWQWLLSVIVWLSPLPVMTWWAYQRWGGRIGNLVYPDYGLLLIYSTIAVAGWLIVVLIVTMWKRRRLSAEVRLGRYRSYLGTLRMLLPPTLALIFAFAIILLGINQAGWNRFVRQQIKVAKQGEVKYWRIGTGHVREWSR